MALWHIERIELLPTTAEDECTTDGSHHVKVNLHDYDSQERKAEVLCQPLVPGDPADWLFHPLVVMGYTPNDFGVE